MNNKLVSSRKTELVKDLAEGSVEDDVCFYSRNLPTQAEELVQFNEVELADLKRRNYRPREIHIQASKACNFKCTMCSWESWQSNVGMMSMELFDKVLNDAKSYGIRKLVFANAQGEPLLNPLITKMIRKAVNAGFWTMVSTNGSPLNTDNTNQLIETGINNIQFSFGGYNKETYETVYVGGKWEQITENLKRTVSLIKEKKAKTSIVINGCYAKELERICSPNSYIARTKAFLRSIGIWEPECQIRIQLPHNFANNIEVIASTASELTNSSYVKKTTRPGLCRVLQHAPGVYFDGKVTACGCLDPNGELNIGDITESSLKEIRESSNYQNYIKDFVKGDFSNMNLCAQCDIPYYDNPDESPFLWQNVVSLLQDTTIIEANESELETKLNSALESVFNGTLSRLPLLNKVNKEELFELKTHTHNLLTSLESNPEAVTKKIISTNNGKCLFEKVLNKPIRKILLAPATKVILENLDWFIAQFDEVVVGDNYKCGEKHFGIEVLSVKQALEKQVDGYFLTTNTPSIESEYRKKLPVDKTITILSLLQLDTFKWIQFYETGLSRAKRVLSEIESSKKPLVVLSSKLLTTAEPTFAALESQDFDVFVVSLWDRMENRQRTGYDEACDVYRNVMLTGYEQLYILQNLKKGKFWIYYDFFFNTGWDTSNAVITYGCAATVMKMASRPVILGMYDVIKPVCLNMDKQHQAFALYKAMLDLADAVVLTSKSDHIAEYLRNTHLKNTPVLSFYRYSFPPEQPLEKLSAQDGERHIVGVTSFLGEVFEPNRVETKNSIRSMLRQGIHFHYYSSNEKVQAFQDQLPPEEKAYFHMETPIWNQRELVKDMSRFDAGWLVGDEATIFAKLIFEIEDRFIRELFTLFVPNGVPTSSMTYGAAGLPVFISRQIKVMMEVYPEGCCIPLDMGEVDNLSTIVQRLDWDALHKCMRDERHRFNIFDQVERLASFIKNDVPEERVALEN